MKLDDVHVSKNPYCSDGVIFYFEVADLDARDEEDCMQEKSASERFCELVDLRRARNGTDYGTAYVEIARENSELVSQVRGEVLRERRFCSNTAEDPNAQLTRFAEEYASHTGVDFRAALHEICLMHPKLAHEARESALGQRV